MALLDSQKLLAKLYTDAALRRRFFAAPEAVAREWNLSYDEAQQLTDILPAEVQRFATSLQSKRLHQAASLLPLCKKALGNRFNSLFREYSATAALPGSSQRYLADALSFVAFLEHHQQVETALAELARYEAIQRQAFSTAPFWKLRRFRYPVHHVARQVAHSSGPPGQEHLPQTRPIFAVWLRPFWQKRPLHFVCCPLGRNLSRQSCQTTAQGV